MPLPASSPSRRRRAGFTLIELLIVIVILGLLLSLVAPAMFQKVGSSQRKTAMAQMQMLSTSIDWRLLGTFILLTGALVIEL